MASFLEREIIGRTKLFILMATQFQKGIPTRERSILRDIYSADIGENAHGCMVPYSIFIDHASRRQDTDVSIQAVSL